MNQGSVDPRFQNKPREFFFFFFYADPSTGRGARAGRLGVALTLSLSLSLSLTSSRETKGFLRCTPRATPAHADPRSRVSVQACIIRIMLVMLVMLVIVMAVGHICISRSASLALYAGV
jgi:hypothetical protein